MINQIKVRAMRNFGKRSSKRNYKSNKGSLTFRGVATLFLTLALVFGLGFVQKTTAQQIPMFGSYAYNNFLLSPSFAGNTEADARLMAINRLQFAGIPGAPTTFLFTADAPFPKKSMGLGGTVYTDKIGLIRQTGVNLGYSYTVNLGDQTTLNFGLGAELGQLNLDVENAQAVDLTDELLNLENPTRLVVNGNAGVHLNYQDFTLGFAAPQVFGTRVTYQNYVSNTEANFQTERHFLGLMKYRFSVKEDVFDLEPIVLMRMVSGVAPQFDINLKGTIKENVFVNLGYRSDYALTFGAGANVSDYLMIGYSYDMAVNEISGYSFGSHEFMLGYRFFKGIDRKQMEDKLREEREKTDELYSGKIKQLETKVDKEKEMNELQREEIESLKDEIEKFKGEIDSMKNMNAELINRDLNTPVDANGDGTIDDEDDLNGDGKVDYQDYKKAVEKGLIDEEDNVYGKGKVGSGGYYTPNNDEPKSQKPLVDGKEIGRYVVVIASFKKPEQLVQHQQNLKRQGDTDKTYGVQSQDGDWYFVFKKSFNDPAVAQAYLNSLPRENLEPFMYPWIYVFE